MRLSRLKIIMIAALKVDEQAPRAIEIIGLINRFAQIWARNRQAKRATQIRKRGRGRDGKWKEHNVRDMLR